MADEIAHTDHPEFVPTALQVIASWPSGSLKAGEHSADGPTGVRLIESWSSCPIEPLFDFVYGQVQENPDAVDARLAELAADPNWGHEVELLNYWHSDGDNLWPGPLKAKWHANGTTLSPGAFQTLTNCRNVWARVLTFLVFTRQCQLQWETRLLAELRGLGDPLPQEQIAPRIRDLDNDEFEVREKATNELVRLGKRAESPLTAALDGPLSPEARRRVQLILEKVRDAPVPPEGLCALEYLRNLRTSEPRHMLEALAARHVLEALAEGRPDAWLTKEVATISKNK